MILKFNCFNISCLKLFLQFWKFKNLILFYESIFLATSIFQNNSTTGSQSCLKYLCDPSFLEEIYIYNLVNIYVKNSFYFWKISIALNKQISIDIDLCAFFCIFFSSDLYDRSCNKIIFHESISCKIKILLLY